jgi:hypothetical protein
MHQLLELRKKQQLLRQLEFQELVDQLEQDVDQARGVVKMKPNKLLKL